MSLSKLSNGTTKATRTIKPDSSDTFRAKPQFLATIDFGTTHCSVTYLMNARDHSKPSELNPTTLKLDDEGRQRVPSCILFNERGEQIGFGHKARMTYSGLANEARPKHHYFEHVKKNIQREAKVNRKSIIFALNGQKFFLVHVIAHVLHNLKEKVVTAVNDFGYAKKAADFDWVITVPAIWKGSGKQMMREAGYRAGLCSGESPPPLEPVRRGSLNPPIEEKSPEKLSLALEPESAAIHCRRATKDAAQSSDFLQATNYLVVDIGGGTVDIATHALVGEYIEELAPPAGNFWGGTTVNEQFQDFLEEFLDDPGFSKYIKSGTNTDIVRHKADMKKLCYQTFELLKQQFGNDEKVDSYLIDFPRTFWKVYKSELVKKKAKDVSIEDDGAAMRLFPLKMDEFFKPTIKEIASLIEDHLQPNLVDTIDTIYWVGGFGGCKYLRKKLEKRLAKLKNFHYSVPPQPDLAVIRGATAFRCDPSVVGKRRADATYGTGCAIAFDATIHREDYKFWNKERKEFRCDHIFQTFVEKGDTICSNEVFVTDYTPASKYLKSMAIQIYSSPNTDISYTTDNSVYQLGEITVDIGGSGLDRKVEILFDFTHTEIQVRARDMTHGHESKVVVDFLSDSK